MTKTLLLSILIAGLAGCTAAKDVRVTKDSVVAQVQAKPRSEPIFYNGKTYQFDLVPDGAGGFGLAVGGMSARQEKDAVAVASSALRYYACPDGQQGHVEGAPQYVSGSWRMAGACR